MKTIIAFFIILGTFSVQALETRLCPQEISFSLEKLRAPTYQEMREGVLDAEFVSIDDMEDILIGIGQKLMKRQFELKFEKTMNSNCYYKGSGVVARLHGTQAQPWLTIFWPNPAKVATVSSVFMDLKGKAFVQGQNARQKFDEAPLLALSKKTCDMESGSNCERPIVGRASIYVEVSH
jgi:hypothetical protein